MERLSDAIGYRASEIEHQNYATDSVVLHQRGGVMRLGDDDFAFVQSHLSSIEGWLLDGAALFTLYLLHYQNKTCLQGPIFEIGVFRGKYLSVLYWGTQGTQTPVVGVDVFTWTSISETETYLRTAFTEIGRLKLIQASSHDFSPDNVIALCGGAPRFISVDGDHTGDGVHSDMNLVASVLPPQGVIAVDDFLNPSAIGVSEGAYRHFLSNPALKPFAYCQNKLFVCNAFDQSEFLSVAWDFAREHADMESLKVFRANEAKGRHWVEQDLLGVKCLIL
jgi:hypothetical protein